MEDGKPDNRSDREQAERRDIEIINQHADELNAEAEDALEYQVDPWAGDLEDADDVL